MILYLYTVIGHERHRAGAETKTGPPMFSDDPRRSEQANGKHSDLCILSAKGIIANSLPMNFSCS